MEHLLSTRGLEWLSRNHAQNPVSFLEGEGDTNQTTHTNVNNRKCVVSAESPEQQGVSTESSRLASRPGGFHLGGWALAGEASKVGRRRMRSLGKHECCVGTDVCRVHTAEGTYDGQGLGSSHESSAHCPLCGARHT